MPLVIMAVMLIMLLMSWDNISNFKNENKRQYNEYIQKAQAYEEKEIDIDAVKYYERALGVFPNDYETAMKIVSIYDKLGNNEKYMTALNNAINSDETKPEPYLMYAKAKLADGKKQDAYTMLRKAENKLMSLKDRPQESLDEISDLLDSLTGNYNLLNYPYNEYYGLHYIGGGGPGQSLVRTGDKYGLVDGTGTEIASCVFDDISFNAGELIGRKADDGYFYTDLSGNKKIVTDVPAEYLGPFTGQYAPVKINGLYGYISKEMEQIHFEYEYAGPFENNIAVVKKDGKWGLINTSFASPTGFVYDEILIDHYGFCATYGVFFAKKDGGKYSLYNLSGQELASGLEDARQFECLEPAAVCVNGKWGYMAPNGQMVIEPQFEDAQSFSIGFGPVKTGGKWGCIDFNAKTLVKPEFDYMGPLNRDARAYVEKEGKPFFIKIDIYS